MESYGLLFKHNLVVEKVYVRTPWVISDQGRIIYESSTKRCYIGRLTGWELLGIYERMIKQNHLSLDDTISGTKQSISALRVPVRLDVFGKLLLESVNYYSQAQEFFYYDTTSNLQFILDAIHQYVDLIDLNDKSIDSISFDSSINSNIFNDIQILLDDVCKLSDKIRIDNSFGYLLGFGSSTIHHGLIDISDFILSISADDIDANCSYISKKSNIQFILDDLHRINIEIDFIKLFDVPDFFDPDSLSLISTNGQDSLQWERPKSNNINVRFPNIFKDEETILPDSILINKYFHPTGDCLSATIVNTITFGNISYTPTNIYSTSLQQGFELLREMQCADPPRSMGCDGVLIINDSIDLNRSMRLEQYKNDINCNTFCGNVDGITTENYMFNIRSNGCIRSSDSGEIANYKATLSLGDTHCFQGCYNSQATGSNFINLQTVFTDWERFAGSGNSTDIWEYVSGSMHSTINNQYPCHFISPEKYDKVSCAITVRSGDEDDDSIYLIIAHVNVGGVVHTLSVVRNKGSNNQGGWGLPLLPTYFIALNYGIYDTPLDQTILATAVDIELGGIDGWNGQFSRLFVCRYNDIITIACSPFNSQTVNENTQITINLDDDSRLSVFKGPQSVGFGCLSQNDSWFSSADFHTIGPPPPSTTIIPDIYDINEQTRWCWNTEDCSWEPTYVEFPCGGTPNPNSPCSPLLTPLIINSRFVYDIRDKSIYEWDSTSCSWNKQQCPNWDIFEKNKLYFNDITCKIYYYDCDGQWNIIM